MYLYLATDSYYQKSNLLFIGISKQSPSRIKSDLELSTNAVVDRVIETPHAKEILAKFTHSFPTTKEKKGLLVEGEHGQIADILLQMTREYEQEHPSIKRSIFKWLTNI